MSKVTFQYEIIDHMGQSIYSCWKTIEMSSAPTPNLIYNDGDFTWQTNRGIQYSLDDDSYFVRTANATPVEPIENYASMFEKLGWEVRSWT